MRKSILFLFAALPSLLLTVSCSQDELDSAQGTGRECVVTFNVTSPDGVQTRSFGDGTTAKSLTYKVYDKDGENLTLNGSLGGTTVFPGNSLETTVSVTLLRGNSYTIVFWADAGDNSPYEVDWNNRTMGLKAGADASTVPVANSENYDAFYKTVDITDVDGSITQVVELKRPFAQLNIGTNDIEEAKTAGLDVKQTKVTVKNLGTTLNLIDGTVSGDETTETTFAYASIPATSNAFPVTAEQGSTAYQYLSMCYLLVDADRQTVDVTLTCKDNSNNEKERTFTQIPVQRNYRTNIYGQLLTGTHNYNVKIAPAFETPDYDRKIVSTSEELKEAVTDPTVANIKLEENLTMEGNLFIAATDNNSNKEIDLNGKTLNLGRIETRVPLVIKNGNIRATDGFSVRGYANADITLDGVDLTATNTTGNAIELGYNRGGTIDCGNAQLSLVNSTINTECAGILIHGANNKVKLENTTINHKYFGITQNGTIPGSEIELKNVNISGTYSGIYLSNYADGAKNTLIVDGGSIHSDKESAIEVKKTDITVKNATLSSSAATQSYSVNGGGSNGVGYGIVLAGYKEGVAYEGTTSFENITYNLAAQGNDIIKILKYNGTEGEKLE